jgi:hypothetical protein
MKPKTPDLEVVYVAGYGRSGSTLLDALLGNHPDVFGGGELTWLFQRTLDGCDCSCGVTLSECSLWREVFKRVFSSMPGFDLKKAAAVTVRTETLTRWRRRDPQYGTLWAATFRAIAEASGRRMVVDSSKSCRLSHHRLRRLQVTTGLPVKALHLVRDPRAVMWSAQRGSNRRLEEGRPARPLGGMARCLLSWIYANSSVELQLRGSGSPDFLRLRYEDLAGAPEETLDEVGRFLGLDIADVVSRIRAGQTLDAGHGVAGNRMRRSGAIVLRVDKEWQSSLPRTARSLAWVARPFLRAYGYDVTV